MRPCPKHPIPPHICADCGWVGVAKARTPGHIGIEVLLWFACLLPGAIYTVWRLSARRPQCPSCSGDRILPIASPAGRQVLWSTSGRQLPPGTPITPVRPGLEADMMVSVVFAVGFAVMLGLGAVLVLLSGAAPVGP